MSTITEFFNNLFADWADRFSSTFGNFSEKYGPIFNDPQVKSFLFMSILALIAISAIFFVLLKAKKIKLTSKMISRIGLAIALACLLHVFRIYRFPQGGSVTLGSMIPIFIIAFTYGKEVGFLTGFIFSLLNLFLDPYIIHPIQVLFDYTLPFAAMGLVAYFPNKKKLGISIAFFARFLCSFLSGVIFFGMYAPEGMSPIIYSFIVNASVIGAEAFVTLVIVSIMNIDKLTNTINSNFQNKVT